MKKGDLYEVKEFGSTYLENAPGYDWPGKPLVLAGDIVEIVAVTAYGDAVAVDVVGGPRDGHGTYLDVEHLKPAVPLRALAAQAE
jgi:hypothetical protein